MNTVVQLPQRVAVPFENFDALGTDLPIVSLEPSVPEFKVLPNDDPPSSHATANVDDRAWIQTLQFGNDKRHIDRIAVRHLRKISRLHSPMVTTIRFWSRS